MPAINGNNREAWQELADKLSTQRPSVGKRVIVQTGKHKGKIGVVRRHMASKFGNPDRYANDAQAHMRAMAGRRGFVCLIDAGETFWVAADKVEIIVDGHDCVSVTPANGQGAWCRDCGETLA